METPPLNTAIAVSWLMWILACYASEILINCSKACSLVIKSTSKEFKQQLAEKNGLSKAGWQRTSLPGVAQAQCRRAFVEGWYPVML